MEGSSVMRVLNASGFPFTSSSAAALGNKEKGGQARLVGRVGSLLQAT
jgi:hypothetical protein